MSQQGVPSVSGDGCRGINPRGGEGHALNTERRRANSPVHLGLRGAKESKKPTLGYLESPQNSFGGSANR